MNRRLMFVPKSEYYDPASTREKPGWFQVGVRFVRALPRPLSLRKIRAISALKNMALVKRGGLSVQPVTEAEWAVILKKVES